MGIGFPWPVSHCAVLYKIAKWGGRTRAKWKRRCIHLPCLWLNGSICLWREVTARSGVWAKANYPSLLSQCTPSPLLQIHASNLPLPSMNAVLPSLTGDVLSVSTHKVDRVKASATLWISLTLQPFLYPCVTNVLMVEIISSLLDHSGIWDKNVVFF